MPEPVSNTPMDTVWIVWKIGYGARTVNSIHATKEGAEKAAAAIREANPPKDPRIGAKVRPQVKSYRVQA